MSDASSDEFALLPDAAEELGLDPAAIPPVRRSAVDVSPVGEPGQQLSVLQWGTDAPELVFVHGGGQNAHTWDLVGLLLGRPMIAVDLPGHGHSSWRSDQDYGPIPNAEAVAVAVRALAPDAAAVIGMSLGGLTTMRLAAAHPDLARKVVLVDVTPGVMTRTRAMTTEQRGTTALVSGPRSYATLEEMVDAAAAASPRRPLRAVRRGVVHNTKQLPDGTWAWRYDVGRATGVSSYEFLWDDVASIAVPLMLVRGGESAFVPEEDATEFGRRSPGARLEVVAGAGHSVQSDRPRELADLIRDFVFG
jgi:pimeloyl-ACP methyl ester carboxylesterase